MFPLFPRRLAATLSLAVVATAVTSCGLQPSQPPRAPGALAFVVGGRNNMPKPELPSSLDKLVTDAIRSGDSVYVVGVSGHPTLVFEKSMARASSECDTQSACDAVVTDFRRTIKRKIAETRASTAEADTLAAIAEAARQLAGSSTPKQLVVIDNGLQTAGEMSLLSDRALFTPPEELALALWSGNRLERRLKGVEITWVGLGAVAAPQQRPDQRPRDNLEALWTKVLTTAGASVRFVGGVQDGPPAHQGMPPVTPVPVKDTVIEPAGCVKIPDDQVGFIPGRAEFRDLELARSVLEPLAKALIAGKRAAEIIGYVALPEQPEPGRLSLRRAVAVKNFLVSLGVPQRLLSVQGAGTPPEYPVPPVTPKPTELQQYRRVEVHVAGVC
ncbi:MAG: hypothetical protein ACRDRX_11225 [Pseudonocardiaceae bacterium]